MCPRRAETVPCVGRKETALAGDPVYRMQVEESTATWVSEHQGNTHYFCTPGCKDAFVENPEQYVSD